MQDAAYRVIAANRAPDRSTIAEFRKRHEAALPADPARRLDPVPAATLRPGDPTLGIGAPSSGTPAPKVVFN